MKNRFYVAQIAKFIHSFAGERMPMELKQVNQHKLNVTKKGFSL